jgi:hypothetical protein
MIYSVSDPSLAFAFFLYFFTKSRTSESDWLHFPNWKGCIVPMKIALLCILIACICAAKILFISDKRGDDATGNGSHEKPYKSLLTAWTKCGLTCTEIVAEPGTYAYPERTAHIFNQERTTLRIRGLIHEGQRAHFSGYIWNLTDPIDFRLQDLSYGSEVPGQVSEVVIARNGDRVSLQNVIMTVPGSRKCLDIIGTKSFELRSVSIVPFSTMFFGQMYFENVTSVQFDHTNISRVAISMYRSGFFGLETVRFDQTIVMMGVHYAVGAKDFHFKNVVSVKTGVPNRSAFMMSNSTGIMDNVNITNVWVGYDHYGGGLHLRNVQLKAINVNLIGNRVEVFGGGFYCDGGSVEMIGGSIQNNWARRGGSCSCAGKCKTSFTNVLFKGNTAIEQPSNCDGVPDGVPTSITVK